MRKLKFILLFVSILIVISRADSFAVSSYCAPRTPCLMSHGEERTFDFLLQSGAGGGDIKVRFELLNDAGIAQIVGDNEFIVPAGSQNVNARLKVKIPEDAQVGTVNIIIKFTEIPSNEGQVSLSPSFTMSFPVIVGEEALPAVEQDKEKVVTWFIVAVALVLAVLIAITIVLIKNRSKKDDQILTE